MTHHYLFGFLILTACCLLHVSSRPSNNEDATELIEDPKAELERLKKSLYFNQEIQTPEETRDILDKIKAVNDGLKKPLKQQINFNHAEPHTGGSYVLDDTTLQKIQQLIASGKLQPYGDTHKHQESNTLTNEANYYRHLDSRALQLGQANVQANQIQTTNMPYLTSIPVLVVPAVNNVQNGNSINEDNSIYEAGVTNYQTRQRPPALPFNIPWPLAPFFPVLVKDPLVGILNGGGWNNFIQYGQAADVCNRKHRILDLDDHELLPESINEVNDDNDKFEETGKKLRQARALKKRTISQTAQNQEIDNIKKFNNLFQKPTTTKKPEKLVYSKDPTHDTKTNNDDEGDLRFPFGEFSWFGNKKPVAPSPGFFINKLKVRRGGVAIAGPGGVATAGRGGAAIVGPGGLAYTQPGGMAVAGPAARVIALSSDTDLSSIVSRLQDQSNIDSSVPRLLKSIPEGKIVATGPVVYYHPNENTLYREWREPHRGFRADGQSFSRRSDQQFYNINYDKGSLKDDSFMVFLKPVAHATNNARGVAIANPISHVVVGQNKMGSIVHAPVASAVVGPGGIAHAQSDLYVYEFINV